MKQARLDFLVVYRGNLVTGFDYIYVKRHEGHAFWQSRDKRQEVKNILDIDFDYYNPHFNEKGESFKWRYQEPWVDMTTSWDAFAQEAMSYLNTWMSEYHGPSHMDASLNDEWGVRYKAPGEHERIIWGLNAFPANLQNFMAFLYHFGQ